MFFVELNNVSGSSRYLEKACDFPPPDSATPRKKILGCIVKDCGAHYKPFLKYSTKFKKKIHQLVAQRLVQQRLKLLERTYTKIILALLKS